MWQRMTGGLTQLPSLITECLAALRLNGWLLQQQLLLQQETNQLLREMIVKVTHQPAETAQAERLPQVEPIAQPSQTGQSTAEPSTPQPAGAAVLTSASVAVPAARRDLRPKAGRILTDRDIIRNTRATLLERQREQQALALHPHREGEILPPPNPPLTNLP